MHLSMDKDENIKATLAEIMKLENMEQILDINNNLAPSLHFLHNFSSPVSSTDPFLLS